jgi:hypothetical protein
MSPVTTLTLRRNNCSHSSPPVLTPLPLRHPAAFTATPSAIGCEDLPSSAMPSPPAVPGSEHPESVHNLAQVPQPAALRREADLPQPIESIRSTPSRQPGSKTGQTGLPLWQRQKVQAIGSRRRYFRQRATASCQPENKRSRVDLSMAGSKRRSARQKLSTSALFQKPTASPAR